MTPERARCAEQVWEPDGWHSHVCGRPVRALMGRGDRVFFTVCGIHARVLERLGYERVGEVGA